MYPRLRDLLEGISGISSLEHLELSRVAPMLADSPVVPATFALKSLMLANMYGGRTSLPLLLKHSTSSLVEIGLAGLDDDDDGLGFVALVARQAPVLQRLLVCTDPGDGLDRILRLESSFPSLIPLPPRPCTRLPHQRRRPVPLPFQPSRPSPPTPRARHQRQATRTVGRLV